MSLRRMCAVWVLICFVSTSVGLPNRAYAAGGVLGLPNPGAMVNLSPAYVPLMVEGLKVHPENPLLFDFIINPGNSGLSADNQQIRPEAQQLIKYFLATLTIPENDLWVNLSPYEKDRTIPHELGQTELGAQMLAQDYILKQLTASLIYPEKGLGKDFWDRVYQESAARFHTTQIPVNTFNKVWIVADKAGVYVHDNTAFVVESHLKVMLEEDYLALQKNRNNVIKSQAKDLNSHSLASSIIREIILPAIDREVNEGKNFAPLRQIYNSMILAAWYKKSLKEALLNRVYADKSKINGVDVNDKGIKEKIYQRYLQAYKKGVFNYIKEDTDPSTQQRTPRKYFSGGLEFQGVLKNVGVFGPDNVLEAAKAQDIASHPQILAQVSVKNANAAMTVQESWMANRTKILQAQEAFASAMHKSGFFMVIQDVDFQVVSVLDHRVHVDGNIDSKTRQNLINTINSYDVRIPGFDPRLYAAYIPYRNALIDGLQLNLPHLSDAAMAGKGQGEAALKAFREQDEALRKAGEIAYEKRLEEEASQTRETEKKLFSAIYYSRNGHEVAANLQHSNNILSVKAESLLLVVKREINAYPVFINHDPDPAGELREILEGKSAGDLWTLTSRQEERIHFLFKNLRALIIGHPRSSFKSSAPAPRSSSIADAAMKITHVLPQVTFQNGLTASGKEVLPMLNLLLMNLGKEMDEQKDHDFDPWSQVYRSNNRKLMEALRREFYDPLKGLPQLKLRLEKLRMDLLSPQQRIFISKIRFEGRPNGDVFMHSGIKLMRLDGARAYVIDYNYYDKGIEISLDFEKNGRTLASFAKLYAPENLGLQDLIRHNEDMFRSSFINTRFYWEASVKEPGQVDVNLKEMQEWLKGMIIEAVVEETTNAAMTSQQVYGELLTALNQIGISQDTAKFSPNMTVEEIFNTLENLKLYYQVESPAIASQLDVFINQLRMQRILAAHSGMIAANPAMTSLHEHNDTFKALNELLAGGSAVRTHSHFNNYELIQFDNGASLELDQRKTEGKQVDTRATFSQTSGDRTLSYTFTGALGLSRRYQRGERPDDQLKQMLRRVKLYGQWSNAAMHVPVVKVLFADKVAGGEETIKSVEQSLDQIRRLHPGTEIQVINKTGIGEEQGVEALKSVLSAEKPDIVLVRSATKFDENLIDFAKANGLKAIIRMGVEYGNIKAVHAGDIGIPVLFTRGSTDSVADLTIHLLKASFFGTKDLPAEYWKLAAKSSKWPEGTSDADKKLLLSNMQESSESSLVQLGEALNGKVIGLYGFGEIGQAVAKRLLDIKTRTGSHFSVIAYTRSFFDLDLQKSSRARRVAGDLHVNPVNPRELFKYSDIVSFHIPDKIDIPRITVQDLTGSAHLKVLINTSREKLIPTPVLLSFLQGPDTKVLGDLDISPDIKDIMAHHKRVFILPHIGASTQSASAGVKANTMVILNEVIGRMLGDAPSKALDIVNGAPIVALSNAAMTAGQKARNVQFIDGLLNLDESYGYIKDNRKEWSIKSRIWELASQEQRAIVHTIAMGLQLKPTNAPYIFASDEIERGNPDEEEWQQALKSHIEKILRTYIGFFSEKLARVKAGMPVAVFYTDMTSNRRESRIYAGKLARVEVEPRRALWQISFEDGQHLSLPEGTFSVYTSDAAMSSGTNAAMQSYSDEERVRMLDDIRQLRQESHVEYQAPRERVTIVPTVLWRVPDSLAGSEIVSRVANALGFNGRSPVFYISNFDLSASKEEIIKTAEKRINFELTILANALVNHNAAMTVKPLQDGKTVNVDDNGLFLTSDGARPRPSKAAMQEYAYQQWLPLHPLTRDFWTEAESLNRSSRFRTWIPDNLENYLTRIAGTRPDAFTRMLTGAQRNTPQASLLQVLVDLLEGEKSEDVLHAALADDAEYHWKEFMAAVWMRSAQTIPVFPALGPTGPMPSAEGHLVYEEMLTSALLMNAMEDPSKKVFPMMSALPGDPSTVRWIFRTKALGAVGISQGRMADLLAAFSAYYSKAQGKTLQAWSSAEHVGLLVPKSETTGLDGLFMDFLKHEDQAMNSGAGIEFSWAKYGAQFKDFWVKETQGNDGSGWLVLAVRGRDNHNNPFSRRGYVHVQNTYLLLSMNAHAQSGDYQGFLKDVAALDSKMVDFYRYSYSAPLTSGGYIFLQGKTGRAGALSGATPLDFPARLDTLWAQKNLLSFELLRHARIAAYQKNGFSGLSFDRLNEKLNALAKTDDPLGQFIRGVRNGQPLDGRTRAYLMHTRLSNLQVLIEILSHEEFLADLAKEVLTEKDYQLIGVLLDKCAKHAFMPVGSILDRMTPINGRANPAMLGRDEILAKLNEVLNDEIFQNPAHPMNAVPGLRLSEDLGLDSLERMNLKMEVEMAFNIYFEGKSDKQFDKSRTVNDIMNVIDSVLIEKNKVGKNHAMLTKEAAADTVRQFMGERSIDVSVDARYIEGGIAVSITENRANGHALTSEMVKVLPSLAERFKGREVRPIYSDRPNALELDIKYGAMRKVKAMSPGGIDLNGRNMSMHVSGDKLDIRFDPSLLAQFKKGDFSGVTPVIVDVTAIPNALGLLGFEADGRLGRLAKA